MSDRHDGRAAGMGRLLGWFSIALGAGQLAVPDWLSRLIGIQPTRATRTLMRAMGLRELVSGFGILTNRKASGWLWARVAGDALDMALLAKALTSQTDKARAGAATAAVAGVTSVDILAARRRRSGGPVAA